MLRAVTLLLPVSLLFIWHPQTAFACRCKSPATSTAYQRAQAVVVATVVSVESKEQGQQLAILSISQAWKQVVPARLPVLSGGQVCGHHFAEGQEYVLYLFVNQDGTYTTSNCVGNKFVNNPTLPAHFKAAAERDLAWLKQHGKAAKIG